MRLRLTLPSLVIGSWAAWAQPVPTGKTAEQAFKNILVLTGNPADQVFPAMQFISASLGVECEFCHVQGKFELDDKAAKKTARQMIAMTLKINKDDFGGHKEVTCFTCHQGHEHPTGAPPVVSSDNPPEHEKETHSADAKAPTVDQILQNYITAVGGPEALHKITSRVEKGNILVGGHETAIEVFAKAPNKRVSVTHASSGDSFTAFDGQNGWLGSSGRPARDMSAPESSAAALDAEFYLPARLREIFTGFRVGRPEQIGDHAAYLLLCMRQSSPPVRLYFDQASGVLLRQVRYTDTPIGRSPTQIDYADYREVDGVKVPFRWTLARVNGRFTIQIQDVKQNVDIPDEKFAKPAAPAASGSGSGAH